jgi:hypothetical protein
MNVSGGVKTIKPVVERFIGSPWSSSRLIKEYGGAYPQSYADSVLVHPRGYALAGDVQFDNLSDDHWRIIVDNLAAGNVVGFVTACDNDWKGATIALRVQQRCSFPLEGAQDREDGVLYLYRLDGPKPHAPADCGETYAAAEVADMLALVDELMGGGGGDVEYAAPSDLAIWLQNQHDSKANTDAMLALAPIVRRVWERKPSETDDD